MHAKSDLGQAAGITPESERATPAYGVDDRHDVRPMRRIAPADSSAQAAAPDTRKRRIFLVDDDRLLLAAISRGLQQAGYETMQALSGQDALRLVAESKPDLVVLDISMPEKYGIELARCLREQGTIPFMFLSAYGGSDIVRQATENGGIAFLMKPLGVTQILPAIEIGLARDAEIGSLRRAQSALTDALAAGRETNTAVGVLMERYRLDRQQAFEILRSHARANRRKIHCVAAEVSKARKVSDLPSSQPTRNASDTRRILRHLAGYPEHPDPAIHMPEQ